MTIAEGNSAFIMSKIRLLIQYAGRDIPEMSCMCFRFFSLSFRIKDTTIAGMRAKPIETTKAMKIPLAVAALYFNL